MIAQPKETVCIGKISGAFGIKGWVKVLSYTDSIENVLSYSPWVLKKGGEVRVCKPVDGKLQNKHVVARIAGIDDRNQAETLRGFEIWVAKSQLPETREGEYYWADLLGLNVVTVTGEPLGVIDSLLETGANDVLIVKGSRERAIPFLQGKTVVSVDLAGAVVTVDWDPDF